MNAKYANVPHVSVDENYVRTLANVTYSSGHKLRDKFVIAVLASAKCEMLFYFWFIVAYPLLRFEFSAQRICLLLVFRWQQPKRLFPWIIYLDRSLFLL